MDFIFFQIELKCYTFPVNLLIFYSMFTFFFGELTTIIQKLIFLKFGFGLFFICREKKEHILSEKHEIHFQSFQIHSEVKVWKINWIILWNWILMLYFSLNRQRAHWSFALLRYIQYGCVGKSMEIRRNWLFGITPSIWKLYRRRQSYSLLNVFNLKHIQTSNQNFTRKKGISSKLA